jgi:hypothetical protein
MKERAQELKAAARRGPRADKADGERPAQLVWRVCGAARASLDNGLDQRSGRAAGDSSWEDANSCSKAMKVR